MKKNHLYRHTLALALMLGMSTGMQAQSARTVQLRRYDDSNITVAQLPQEQRKVVFLGNSITDNWGSWRKDFFQSHGYICRGISGQTSYEFLGRFREDVVALHPQAVVINVATNDIAENTYPYNEDITFGNLESMCEIARANHIKVILTSTLPAHIFPWRKSISGVPSKIMHLNARIKAYARKHHMAYADYYSQMADSKTQGMRKDITLDGVHPNVKGYSDVMEPLIVRVISQVLK